MSDKAHEPVVSARDAAQRGRVCTGGFKSLPDNERRAFLGGFAAAGVFLIAGAGAAVTGHPLVAGLGLILGVGDLALVGVVLKARLKRACS